MVTNELTKKNNRRKIITRAVLIMTGLAAAVIIFALYSRSGIAMETEQTPICGMEEHTHGPDCYEKVLICGYDGNEVSFATPTDLERVSAGETETETEAETESDTTTETAANHVHTDACYEEVLICEKPEHVHTAACYPATEEKTTADETTSDETATEVPAMPESTEETTEFNAEETSNSTSCISGIIWSDANSDAVMQPTEKGVAGFTVNLYAEANINDILQTVVTDDTGAYTFTGLEPGNYVVGIVWQTIDGVDYLLPMAGISGDNRFVMSGDWTAAYTNAITVAADEVTGINAGMRPPMVAKATSNTGTINVTKTITGAASTNINFIFDLVQVNSDGSAAPNPIMRSVTINGADFISGSQNFSFDLSNLALGAGSYWFKVTERDTKTPGWTYDTSEYIVRVDIGGIPLTTVVTNVTGSVNFYSHPVNEITYPSGLKGMETIWSPNMEWWLANPLRITSGSRPFTPMFSITGLYLTDPNNNNNVVIGSLYCADYGTKFMSQVSGTPANYNTYNLDYYSKQLNWIVGNGFWASGKPIAKPGLVYADATFENFVWEGINNIDWLRAKYNIPTLTQGQACIATQCAIWYFTENGALAPGMPVDGDPYIATDLADPRPGLSLANLKLHMANVIALYDQLVAGAQGAQYDMPPNPLAGASINMNFDTSGAVIDAAGWYGPVTLLITDVPPGQTAANIPVTLTSAYAVSADKTGTATTMSAQDGTQFYINVGTSANIPSMSELVKADAEVQILVGGSIADAQLYAWNGVISIGSGQPAIGIGTNADCWAIIHGTATLNGGSAVSQIAFANSYVAPPPQTYSFEFLKVYAPNSYTANINGTNTTVPIYSEFQGAGFTLFSNYNTSTKDIKFPVAGPVVSDSDGIVQFTGLAPGTYYMMETSAPATVSLSGEVYKVVIDRVGKSTVWVWSSVLSDWVEKDKIIYLSVPDVSFGLNGKFNIYKTDSFNNGTYVIEQQVQTDDTGVALVTGLWSDSYTGGYKIKAVDDTDGTWYIGTIGYYGEGNYTCSWTKPTGGFFGYYTDGSYDYIANKYSIGFEFTKTDDKGNPLAGAKFKLYTSIPALNYQNPANNNYAQLLYADGVTPVESTSDANGKVSFTGLDLTKLDANGYFYMKEILPPGGYSSIPYVYRISFNADGTLNKIEWAQYSLWAQYINLAGDWATLENNTVINSPYKIEFTKTDGDTGNILLGAEFSLYSDAACTDLIMTAVSDENGKVSFMMKDVDASKLPSAGTSLNYYMKETNPPEGYSENPVLYRVMLYDYGVSIISYQSGTLWYELGTTPGGIAPASVENIKTQKSYYVLNAKKPQLDLEFKKVDDKGQPLTGAEFTLYSGGTAIATTLSDSFGTVKFDNLDEGTYTMKETKPPKGYTVNGTVYTVTVASTGTTINGSAASGFSVTNAKIPATPANVTIVGKKTVTGTGADANKAFTFKIESCNAAGVTDGITNRTTTGTMASGFSFTVNNLTGGTYYYKITEDQTGNGIGGWTYDGNWYVVRVDVDYSGNYAVTYPGVTPGYETAYKTNPDNSITEYNRDFNIDLSKIYIYENNKGTDEPFNFDKNTTNDPSIKDWAFTCYDYNSSGPHVNNEQVKYEYDPIDPVFTEVAIASSLIHQNYGAKVSLADFNAFFGLNDPTTPGLRPVNDSYRYRLMQCVSQFYAYKYDPKYRDAYPGANWSETDISLWPSNAYPQQFADQLRGRKFDASGNILGDMGYHAGDDLTYTLAQEFYHILTVLENLAVAYHNAPATGNLTSLSMLYTPTSPTLGTLSYSYVGYQPPKHNVNLTWTAATGLTVKKNGIAVTSPVSFNNQDAVITVEYKGSGTVDFALDDPSIYIINGSISGAMFKTTADTVNHYQRLVTGNAKYVKLACAFTLNSSSGTVAFTNIYTQKADINIPVEKKLSGIDSTTKTFTFNLIQVNSDGSAWTGTDPAITDSKTVTGAGTESFEITGLTEGEYYFKITEDQTGSGIDGWKYDDISYIVKVVMLNGKAIIYYPDGTIVGGVTTGEEQKIPIEPSEVLFPSDFALRTMAYRFSSFGVTSPMLRYAEDENGNIATGAAYCIDLGNGDYVDTGYLPYYDYDSFVKWCNAGNKDSDAILWLLRNGFMSTGTRLPTAGTGASYDDPNISTVWQGNNNLDEIRALTGINDLLADEAYWATQFAIWSFDENNATIFSRYSVYVNELPNLKLAYDILRAKATEAKSGGEVITEASLSVNFDISGATLSGGWYGPVKIEANLLPADFTDLNNINISLTSDYQLAANTSGAALPAILKSGSTFYVNVGANSANSGVKLATATATAAPNILTKDVYIFSSIDGSGGLNLGQLNKQAFAGVAAIRRTVDLKATANLYYGAEQGSLTFNNTYAQYADVIIKGKKVVTGNAPTANKDFTFTLSECNETGDIISPSTVVPTPLTVTAHTAGAGEYAFEFPKITGVAPGMYYFKVSEINNTPQYGWQYDENSYIVVVVVDAAGNTKIYYPNLGTVVNAGDGTYMPATPQNNLMTYDPTNRKYTFKDSDGRYFFGLCADKWLGAPQVPYGNDGDKDYIPAGVDKYSLMNYDGAHRASALAFALYEQQGLFNNDSMMAEYLIWYYEFKEYYPEYDWTVPDNFSSLPNDLTGLNWPDTLPEKSVELSGTTWHFEERTNVREKFYDEIKGIDYDTGLMTGTDRTAAFAAAVKDIDAMMANYSETADGKCITSLNMLFEPDSSSSGWLSFSYDGYQPPAHSLTLSWTATLGKTFTIKDSPNGNVIYTGGGSGSKTINIGDRFYITYGSETGSVTFTLTDGTSYLVNGSIYGDFYFSQYDKDNVNNLYMHRQRMIIGYAKFAKITGSVVIGKGEFVTFENKYEEPTIDAVIEGNKTATGGDHGKVFEFVMEDLKTGEKYVNKKVGAGEFTFAAAGLKPGVYTYKITETAGAAGDGWTYDEKVYTVTVTVTYNGVSNSLSASVAYSIQGAGTASKADFVNVYDNTGGPRLPDAGGKTALLFAIIGGALTAISISLLYYRNLKKKISRRI